MANSVRDSFMPALKLKKCSTNTTDEKELKKAVELLKKQAPLVSGYYVDECGDLMVAGDAAIALVYSGEAAYAQSLNDDLAYSLPKEGTNKWIDSWMITKKCKNVSNAEKFLNYLCREDVARRNFDYVYYATPNRAVYENLDEKTKKNKTIFTDIETLSKCELYHPLDKEATKMYNDLWKELKSENK